MTLIAICGFQGAGKDTLANILIEKYGFTKLSFAGAVKDVASSIFGWDREMLEGTTPESRKQREIVDEWWSKRLNIPNLTPRWVLQNFGTDLFRNHFHQEIWVACVEKKISSYKNVVITDCRFPNEVSAVQNLGGKIIHIYRKKLPDWFNDYKNGIIDPPKDLHPSEWSWIKSTFDLEINNNLDNIEDLNNHIDIILS